MLRRCCRMLSLVVLFGGNDFVTAAEPAVFPGDRWIEKSPADVGMDAAKLEQARDYALTGGGSGYITRHGYLVMKWGDEAERYDLKSSTKSFGSTALGVAVMDGKIRLDDSAVKYHPTFGVPPESNRDTGWIDRITIRHLVTQTAGFDKPGGYQKLLFAPGSEWAYSDCGPNWVAECITLAYHRDLNDLMFERVFTPIGVTPKDLAWRENSYRDKTIEGIKRREFGSGISANANALARVGYLYLRNGEWNGKRLLPAEYIAEATRPAASIKELKVANPEHYSNASDHYGFLWWTNGHNDLPEAPTDAYWSWGLYDSFIIVIPSLDVVVGRAGKSWARTEGAHHYGVLKPFLGRIVEACTTEGPSSVKNSELRKELLSRAKVDQEARHALTKWMRQPGNLGLIEKIVLSEPARDTPAQAEFRQLFDTQRRVDQEKHRTTDSHCGRVRLANS